MSDDVLLDQAAQLVADARVACLKLAIPPAEIAKIMMDEAVLALMAERLSLMILALNPWTYSPLIGGKSYAGPKCCCFGAEELISNP